MSKNDLNPSIVKFVINKYYKGYMPEHWDELYSYGLEALYRADATYDKTKTTKTFVYYATCVIKRNIYMYVRDVLARTYNNTSYFDDEEFLEYKNFVEMPSVTILDLYNEIEKLSVEQKTFLYYYYYLGYTIEETSQKMGIPHRTLDRRKAKLLKTLRENL